MLLKQLSVLEIADTTWGIGELCNLTNEADGLSLGVASHKADI